MCALKLHQVTLVDFEVLHNLSDDILSNHQLPRRKIRLFRLSRLCSRFCGKLFPRHPIVQVPNRSLPSIFIHLSRADLSTKSRNLWPFDYFVDRLDIVFDANIRFFFAMFEANGFDVFTDGFFGSKP